MHTLSQLFLILETVIFLTIVSLHLAKKKLHLVVVYVIQSLSVVALLLLHAWELSSQEIFYLAILVFFIKCIFAPYFFHRYTKPASNLLVKTYLNVPLTLLVLLGLVFLSTSDVFLPVITFLPQLPQLPMMLISSVLMSLFLLIVRKDIFSQIIGILSLENAIVAFSFFLGLTQTFTVEIGILFNVGVWLVIAVIFVKLLYEKLGITDITALHDLTK